MRAGWPVPHLQRHDLIAKGWWMRIARFFKPTRAWFGSYREIEGPLPFSSVQYIRSADGLIEFRGGWKARTGIMTKKVSEGPVMRDYWVKSQHTP